ncbi:MAG TPA: hypothetical protein VG537_06175 [Candidatus Kapabacteria bacterium]|jgi:hypothetical protein|nr:hypothetical protein [Candidatus Kapabacteria bacterium]
MAIFEPVRDVELFPLDIFLRTVAEGRGAGRAAVLTEAGFRVTAFLAAGFVVFFGAARFTDAAFTGFRAEDFKLFFAGAGFAFDFEGFDLAVAFLAVAFGRADAFEVAVFFFNFAIVVVLLRR